MRECSRSDSVGRRWAYDGRVAARRGDCVNRIAVAALTIASVLVASPITRAQHTDAAAEGTFSIVARDPSTGELGMAVQSKALATGYNDEYG